MTETPITHIERIEIKGLWGKYDIDWTLDPKVNILIGINGSGKSTVLNLVENVFHRKSSHIHLINEIDIIFNIGNLSYEILPENLSQQINKISDNTIEKLDDIAKNVLKEIKKGKITHVFSGSLNDEVRNYQNLEKIATFEIEYQPLEAIQKLSNQYIKTNLDWDLWKLEKDFQGYQSKILNRYRKEKRENVFEKSDLFTQIINQLFEKTNKVILVSEESDIHFKQGKEIISIYQLSSGEKQILIILLKVLLQDNQPYILLLDEPEISMHVTWQHSLIENIQKLNENCQLIIATHSPSLLGKVWHGKVVEMSEIAHPITELAAP